MWRRFRDRTVRCLLLLGLFGFVRTVSSARTLTEHTTYGTQQLKWSLHLARHRHWYTEASNYPTPSVSRFSSWIWSLRSPMVVAERSTAHEFPSLCQCCDAGKRVRSVELECGTTVRSHVRARWTEQPQSSMRLNVLVQISRWGPSALGWDKTCPESQHPQTGEQKHFAKQSSLA